MIKHRFLLLIFILLAQVLSGQKGSPPSIVIKTHTYSDGVAIRWTPSEASLWQKWNNNGYRLERQTIEKNGETLVNGELVLMGGKSIKSLSDSVWTIYANNTPEAGLIQSCLFQDINVENRLKKDIISNFDDANQCYAFSMLAMQQKFELALAAGLGYLDNSIKNDEVYLYKLYPVNSVSNDTQLFVVDCKEITQLPIIENFTARVVENRIQLKWNGKKYHSDYFGFQIERSMDSGKTFYPVNASPIIPNYANNEQVSTFEIYSDSILRYEYEIQYRIKGMSFFGQYDIPSLPDTVVAFPETFEFPKELSVVISVDSIGQLKWNYDKKSERLISGFNISIADSANGEFKTLDLKTIQPNVRRFELALTKPVSYLRVNAITKNGTLRPSFPLMVQIVDSFPPVAPSIISVAIDTNGVVKISWPENKETDLLGYKLFRGNSRTSEFSSISPHYLLDTFWTDTLINTFIRDSIYYKLVAFDNRFNQSVYSKIMAVKVPNRIPPAPPLIYDISSEYDVVSIKWHHSSSNDVDHYVILKFNPTSKDTTEIFAPKSKNSYLDSQIIQGNLYFYTIKAMDFDGIGSICAKPREVQIPFRLIMPEVVVKAVFTDTITKRVDIFWEYDYDSAVSHYRIYQVDANNALQTIGTAEHGKTFYNYYYMPPYTTKRFKIVAYFKNGRRSKL